MAAAPANFVVSLLSLIKLNKFDSCMQIRPLVETTVKPPRVHARSNSPTVCLNVTYFPEFIKNHKQMPNHLATTTTTINFMVAFIARKGSVK